VKMGRDSVSSLADPESLSKERENKCKPILFLNHKISIHLQVK